VGEREQVTEMPEYTQSVSITLPQGEEGVLKAEVTVEILRRYREHRGW
jgi:hypothetical protein